jgi:glycogen operon protein
MLIVFNAHFEDVSFTLPHATGGECWTRRIDTAIAGDAGAASAKPGDVYDVHARSLVLLELESAAPA